MHRLLAEQHEDAGADVASGRAGPSAAAPTRATPAGPAPATRTPPPRRSAPAGASAKGTATGAIGVVVMAAEAAAAGKTARATMTAAGSTGHGVLLEVLERGGHGMTMAGLGASWIATATRAVAGFIGKCVRSHEGYSFISFECITIYRKQSRLLFPARRRSLEVIWRAGAASIDRMRFSAYAALNGAFSTLIGVLFIVAGFPGLFAGTAGNYWWIALPSALAVLVPLGLVAARRGIPIPAPGRWLTDRSIAAARPGLSVLPERALRRRLIVETVVWAAIALAVIAGFTTSRPFAYATGWASLAYGLLELLASAPRIRAVEFQRGQSFLVHRRPGFGTPDLTVTPTSRR